MLYHLLQKKPLNSDVCNMSFKHLVHHQLWPGVVVIQSSTQKPRYIGVFMSRGCIALQQPRNECNDSVLSNKISSTLSNPPVTTSTVTETTLAFLWHCYGTQMSS